MPSRKPIQKRFGERCRQLRHECGLSQMDMVRNFDWSLSHYQKLERGDLDARLTTVERLAASFKVTVAELLIGV
jgi:transcriptional regulator with XRE-family HTH domain